MPIIEATRLTVSNFHGVSLSARGFANIVVNPTYLETQSLRAWRARNHLLLAELVKEKNYLEHEVPHPQIPYNNFSSIANVITNNVDDKFWIKSKASMLDVNQKFWYTACGTCFKGITAQYGWNITCNFCHSKTIAKPRAKFVSTLSDNSTQLELMIFGELVENLLGLTSLKLMELEQENKIIDSVVINEQLSQKEFIIQIKTKMAETHYGMEYRYIGSFMVEAAQVSKHKHAQEISSSSVGVDKDIAETCDNAQVQSLNDDSHQTSPPNLC